MEVAFENEDFPQFVVLFLKDIDSLDLQYTVRWMIESRNIPMIEKTLDVVYGAMTTPRDCDHKTRLLVHGVDLMLSPIQVIRLKQFAEIVLNSARPVAFYINLYGKNMYVSRYPEDVEDDKIRNFRLYIRFKTIRDSLESIYLTEGSLFVPTGDVFLYVVELESVDPDDNNHRGWLIDIAENIREMVGQHDTEDIMEAYVLQDVNNLVVGENVSEVAKRVFEI